MPFVDLWLLTIAGDLISLSRCVPGSFHWVSRTDWTHLHSDLPTPYQIHVYYPSKFLSYCVRFHYQKNSSFFLSQVPPHFFTFFISTSSSPVLSLIWSEWASKFCPLVITDVLWSFCTIKFAFLGLDSLSFFVLYFFICWMGHCYRRSNLSSHQCRGTLHTTYMWNGSITL